MGDGSLQPNWDPLIHSACVNRPNNQYHRKRKGQIPHQNNHMHFVFYKTVLWTQEALMYANLQTQGTKSRGWLHGKTNKRRKKMNTAKCISIGFHTCAWIYTAECKQSSLPPHSGVNLLLHIRTEAAFVLHILKATYLICIHTNSVSLQVYK